MNQGWREDALAEIDSIKCRWADRYGWQPHSVEEEDTDYIDLYVRFSSKKQPGPFLLCLRYQEDFRTAGRREAFVDPDDKTTEGPSSWPAGSAFKSGNSPPAICLEGTWGFHSALHRDRDGRRANLNRLLMEIQRCLDQ